ncbi:MAG: alpha/beta hydrolase [Actinobacteria bacterium]|nr:alpha/beta hydrolase [Actinomycetota bacterium]
MPLDPAIQDFLGVLRQLQADGLKRTHDMTPPEARETFRRLALARRGDHAGDPVASVEDTSADDVPVRVYVPEGTPRAAMVFLHGGGWVIGDLDTHDVQARSFAFHAGVVVVSVDYRLAPEHPFPAALEDAHTATRWTAARLPDWGVERLVVGGDSAGGNLAAVLAQELRGSDIDLAAQVLVYPAVDMTQSHASIARLGEGYYLERATMRWFADHYMADADPADPRLSPLFADDLSGLPPAVVVTAEYDPLVDEGDAYAEALRAAGVEVRHHSFPGLIHGFYGMGGLSGPAQAAIGTTCLELVALLEEGRGEPAVPGGSPG